MNDNNNIIELPRIVLSDLKIPVFKFPSFQDEIWCNGIVKKNDSTMHNANQYHEPQKDRKEINNIEKFSEKISIQKMDDNDYESPFPIVNIKVSGLNDISGLDEVKQRLKEAIIYPLKYPHLFTNGRTVFTRTLLYGVPGVGKTALVHAIAAEAGLNLYQITSADISSSWHGESEKMIRQLFEKIGNKRCLLFLDEVDSLCRKSSLDDALHCRRSTTELLMQMQNFEGSPMFIIGATNCPWDIDPAFMRRFQQMIYVPQPDRSARESIILEGIKGNMKSFINVDLNRFIEATDGFTGSDLKNLIRSALMIPLREMEKTMYWKKTENGFYFPCNSHDENAFYSILDDIPNSKVLCRSLNINDLWKAYKNTAKSVTNDDIKKYINFKTKRMNKY